MSETLWITIPINDENALKNVTSLIASKNLPSLSIDQLVTKLESGEATDWKEVLQAYDDISSVKNIPNDEMTSRATSVRSKFDRKNNQGEIIYPELKNKLFAPNQLLSLVILCYSNPNLIGPKLCRALNDNNPADVKKEMLENSARVGNRVAPWASNLRLLSTGLYFNDTNIRLPDSVIERITSEIRDGLQVTKWDERNNITEVIADVARASVQQIVHKRRDVSETESSFYPLNVEDASSSASPISYGNQSALTPEVSAIKSTNNAAHSVNLNPMLIMGVAALAFANRIPVISPVTRNMVSSVKDICAKAIDSTSSFFSSVKPMQPSKGEQLEEQQPIFKTG